MEAREIRDLEDRELTARADAVAHRLSGLGVGPETLVAVCAERSLELPVALLGDQGYPLAHPGIFDELARLPFKRRQYGADRHAHAGHNCGGVGIH